MGETVAVLVGAMLFLPWVVYLVIKLGTLGYLRAYKKFNEETENGE